MVKILQYVLLSCCLFFTSYAKGQSSYILVLQPTSSHPIPVGIPATITTSSLQQRNVALQELQLTFWQKGYAAFSIDSIAYFNDTAALVMVYVGEKFIWKQLTIPQNIEGFSIAKDSVVNWNLLADKFYSYCNTLSNNGYPFAAIQLKNVSFNQQYVSAEIAVDSGKKYLIDTIEINGKVKLQQNFLHRYLGIAPKKLYSQQAINAIDSLLQSLPYISLTKPTNVVLQNTGAKVLIHVANKPSNEVDALVGFLPQSPSEGGKLQIVGEAKVQLNNALGSGEKIGINWQQLQPQSPRLLLQFQQPFFLKSAMGIAANFQLYKKDSAFITLQFSVAATRNISLRQQLKFLLHTYRSNTLVIDTLAIKNSFKLPEVNDVSINSLGIAYLFNKLNNVVMPTKGVEFSTDLLVGNKKILKNNTITQLKNASFNYASLYDSVTLNSYQVKVQLLANKYYSIKAAQVMKLGIKAGLLQSENYFKNELFQIGGYKILRGFNEESIFCNRYAVATTEYRFILAPQSFLFSFLDVAMANEIQNNRFTTNTFFGAGFGIALSTKSGILNVAYALGKTNNEPVNFRESKLHLNFTTIL